MFMFKVLVLPSLYGLTDDQTQHQILDRRSFYRFLGITDAENVPGQNTIREFREKLTESGMFEDLFSSFDTHLDQRGFMTVSMKTIHKRCVGMVRNRASSIFCNLIYNMARTE